MAQNLDETVGDPSTDVLVALFSDQLPKVLGDVAVMTAPLPSFRTYAMNTTANKERALYPTPNLPDPHSTRPPLYPTPAEAAFLSEAASLLTD